MWTKNIIIEYIFTQQGTVTNVYVQAVVSSVCFTTSIDTYNLDAICDVRD